MVPKCSSDNESQVSLILNQKLVMIKLSEEDVSKAYLRCLFKSLNREDFVAYLTKHSKSRAKDIRFIMERFLHFFISSWQGYGDDKKQVLKEIVSFIDSWL